MEQKLMHDYVDLQSILHHPTSLIEPFQLTIYVPGL